MNNKLNIKKYWDDQAKNFKKSPLATAPDVYYRDLEINRIIGYLKNNKSVLDIGCGNGFSTLKFAEKFPKSKFVGVDYSEEMIKYAKKNQARKDEKIKKRVEFRVGNIMSLSKNREYIKKFDCVISERCVINLKNWNEQKIALLEIKKVLKKRGKIIFCENTQEGLARLNGLRELHGLKPIAVRWHNYYLPQKKFLNFAKKNFIIKKINNIGSLYYIISRVVYAKLCEMENKNPRYLHPINKIASRLPSIGEYSPNYIFVLENKV